MSRTHTKSRAETARYLLTGGLPEQESDEDLEKEGLEWEWIYSDGDAIYHAKSQEATRSRKRKATGALLPKESRRIEGAKRGNFEVRIGDIIFLKAERDDNWVAILSELIEEELDGEKTAVFMWFSYPREIRNKSKRRADALENEVYITPAFDENVLDSINGKAEVVSLQEFQTRYPSGKIPRASKDFGKLFVCRHGCNTRTATYTEEFVWDTLYRGPEDLQELKTRIEKETKATRKRKLDGNKRTRDLDDFVAQGDDEPRTPRKRRKIEHASTPKSESKRTPSKFTTPTHKRIIAKKPLEFTPLGTRILPPGQISSPFQIARNQLHVSSVPAALPCREEEFSSVYSYLESAITDGTGSCIYISGTPGTGKTATVREVVAQLNASVQAEELDDFIFVEINGMKVTDPHQSYALLWEALSGERISPTHALTLLEREFSTPSPRRVPCVVLMDELDQLVTKSQSVMYNFFNWPNLLHSRLIVLAVANTMDLPERTLSNKISSRLGLTRITFTGYTHEQLIKIIQSRLEGVPGRIVDQDAIQFASRKVAQVSGDARRALDICRRAVEIAEADAIMQDDASSHEPMPDTPSKKHPSGSLVIQKDSRVGRVTIQTVQRAIREATSSPLQMFLKHLPLSAKLLLAALLGRIRKTGIGECLMGDVIAEAKAMGDMSELRNIHDFLLSRKEGVASDYDKVVGEEKQIKCPRVLGIASATTELVEAGVIMLEARKGDRHAKVRLNVGDEEIKAALMDDEDVRGLGFS